MIEQVKEYTQEQINNAEKMCQLIQSIPESRRQLCVVSMIAYMDGIEAGINMGCGTRQVS